MEHAAQRASLGQPSAEGDSLEKMSDSELIAGSQLGDELAFQSLVKRYERRAYWIALGLLGRHEDAWDVAQEAFIRVFRALHRFDFSRSFTTWFFRIVQNLSIDRLRKQSARRSVALEDLGETPCGGEDPGAPLESQETCALVRGVIRKLPVAFRCVMVLRDLEGLSCKEIAPVVGATHATVRWRLHRARKLFKEHWERMMESGRAGPG